MINKKIIIVLAIVLIVVLTSLIIGFQLGKKASKGVGNVNNDFQTGWNAAKERLVKSGMSLTFPSPVTSLSGEVKMIDNSGIIIKITPLEPLADPVLDEREIIINKETKIYSLVQKDQKTLEKELADFNAKLKNQKTNEPIPQHEFFTRKEVAVTDIKIGMFVTVETEGDIKNVKSFQAKEIFFQPEIQPVVEAEVKTEN